MNCLKTFLTRCHTDQSLFFPVCWKKINHFHWQRKYSKRIPPGKKRRPFYRDHFITQSIETLEKEYTQADSAGFYHIISKLKKDVDYIASHDCTIIFFEMPVDSMLFNSAKMKREREIMRTAFSDKKFIWANTDTGSTYVTSDGIHLLDNSLEKYIHYFNNGLAHK